MSFLRILKNSLIIYLYMSVLSFILCSCSKQAPLHNAYNSYQKKFIFPELKIVNLSCLLTMYIIDNLSGIVKLEVFMPFLMPDVRFTMIIAIN